SRRGKAPTGAGRPELRTVPCQTSFVVYRMPQSEPREACDGDLPDPAADRDPAGRSRGPTGGDGEPAALQAAGGRGGRGGVGRGGVPALRGGDAAFRRVEGRAGPVGGAGGVGGARDGGGGGSHERGRGRPPPGR